MSSHDVKHITVICPQSFWNQWEEFAKILCAQQPKFVLTTEMSDEYHERNFPQLEHKLCETQFIFAFDVSLALSYAITRFSNLTGIPLIFGFSSDAWQSWQAKSCNLKELIIKQSLLVIVRGFGTFQNLQSYQVTNLCYYPFSAQKTLVEVSDMSRHRFRGYVGLSDQHKVILWDHRGEYQKGFEGVFLVLKQLQTTLETKSDYILLIVGQGPDVDLLKHQAYAQGAGEFTYFICENYEMIIGEIYNASDMVFLGDKAPLEQVHSALNLGLIPLCLSPSLASGIASCDYEIFEKQTFSKQLELVLTYLHKGQNLMQSRRLSHLSRMYSENQKQEFFSHLEIIIWESQNLIQKGVNPKYLFGTREIRSSILCERGLEFLHEGHWEDSLNYFELALQHNESSVDAYDGLGQIALMTQSYEDARMFYEKAFQLNAQDKRILFHYGQALEKCGFYEESLACVMRAITIDPHFPGPKTLFIDLCLRHFSPEVVEPHWQTIMGLCPDCPKIQAGFGRFLMQNGKNELGMGYLKKAGLL